MVVSGWSAISAYGVGRAEFATGILTGRCALGDVTEGPFDQGGVVPDFAAATHLGRKGTRTMDRVTALAVRTVGDLLADTGLIPTDRVGVVLGTGHGSVQSIMDFTADSLTGDKPYHVDPARFPNTVMNRAAGQIAIWHGIKGPNTTIAGDRLTGLLALSYARRLHGGGRADQVLCGAAEEYSTRRAWLEWHGRDTADHATALGEDTADQATPLGEGAAAVLLESRDSAERAGREPLATVLGTRFMAYHQPSEAADALAQCIRAVLTGSGTAGADVRVVVPLGGDMGRAEEDGVVDALGGSGQKWVHTRPLIGDTSSAATALQLAAALAMLEADPAGPALVTGIDRDGTVGCCLLGVGR